MRRARLLAALLALGLGGCLEVEERWALTEGGGGTYALRIAWDADLLQRARARLGDDVVARAARGAPPLEAAAWRDGLAGLEGVRVEALEERALEGGWQEIRLALAFDRLEALLRWEVLAARSPRVTVERRDAPDPDDPARLAEGDLVRWRLPGGRVPVLHEVRAGLRALEGPPPGEADTPRDPPPLARWGIDREDAGLWAAILRPALSRARIERTFAPPGPVVEVDGKPADREEVTVVGAGDALDRAAGVAIDVTWRALFGHRLPLPR